MKPVFLDTVGLIALWDSTDQWHAADAANHALAALRYLIAPLDKNTLARRSGKAETPTSKTPEQLAEEERNRQCWEMLWSDDPRIWRRIW
jgi:hypothetical protein